MQSTKLDQLPEDVLKFIIEYIPNLGIRLPLRCTSKNMMALTDKIDHISLKEKNVRNMNFHPMLNNIEILELILKRNSQTFKWIIDFLNNFTNLKELVIKTSGYNIDDLDILLKLKTLNVLKIKYYNGNTIYHIEKKTEDSHVLDKTIISYDHFIYINQEYPDLKIFHTYGREKTIVNCKEVYLFKNSYQMSGKYDFSLPDCEKIHIVETYYYCLTNPDNIVSKKIIDNVYSYTNIDYTLCRTHNHERFNSENFTTLLKYPNLKRIDLIKIDTIVLPEKELEYLGFKSSHKMIIPDQFNESIKHYKFRSPDIRIKNIPENCKNYERIYNKNKKLVELNIMFE